MRGRGDGSNLRARVEAIMRSEIGRPMTLADDGRSAVRSLRPSADPSSAVR